MPGPRPRCERGSSTLPTGEGRLFCFPALCLPIAWAISGPTPVGGLGGIVESQTTALLVAFGILLAVAAVAVSWMARRYRRAARRIAEMNDRIERIGSDLAQTRRRARELAIMAKSAKALRNEFLSNISHEVRTPMNAIMGMTELALETDLTDRQRRYLDRVHDSADALLGLLNDLLDLSKFHVRRLWLHPVAFNLSGCIENLVSRFDHMAHEKDVALRCDMATDMPENVMGDPGRLRQAVGALVSNALKFTEEGQVTVSARTESVRENVVQLNVTVSDTGIGISDDQQQLIFEAFKQADGSETREYGGCGIGLTLASQLASLMKGRLWIESQLGQGSTFHFTAEFPIAESAKSVLTMDDAQRLHDQPVLVVSQCSDTRDALGLVLAGMEMNFLPVDDTATALAVIEQACQRNRPAPLVLIDGDVTQKATVDLTKRLTGDNKLGKPHIMVVVAAGRRGDAALCQELGIEGYLTRPITKTELADAIAMVLAPPAADEVGKPLVTLHVVREHRRSARRLPQPSEVRATGA
jgi:two-component system, sensor histidine kinase and response regulator